MASYGSYAAKPRGVTTPAAPTGSGDTCLINQSENEHSIENQCWTIKNFREALDQPKLLKSHVLEFLTTFPPVKFTVQLTKTGIICLKPFVKRSMRRKHSKAFVKFGFSVGPHAQFHEDFSLESPTIQVKNLNKSRLKILDSQLLLRSYTVEGDLNLIVRMTSLKAKTSYLRKSPEEVGLCPVKSCSQFAPIRDRNQDQIITSKNTPVADINEASVVTRPFTGINDTTNYSETKSDDTYAWSWDNLSDSSLKPVNLSKKPPIPLTKKEPSSQSKMLSKSKDLRSGNTSISDYDFDDSTDSEIPLKGQESRSLVKTKLSEAQLDKTNAVPFRCNCDICENGMDLKAMEDDLESDSSSAPSSWKSKPYKSSFVFKSKSNTGQFPKSKSTSRQREFKLNFPAYESTPVPKSAS